MYKERREKESERLREERTGRQADTKTEEKENERSARFFFSNFFQRLL